jgi:hypothetical protein
MAHTKTTVARVSALIKYRTLIVLLSFLISSAGRSLGPIACFIAGYDANAGAVRNSPT